MTRPISDLDVPLPLLRGEIVDLVARQRDAVRVEGADARLETLAAAAQRTHSPSDRIAYELDACLIGHPDRAVSTDLDYPAWAAALATQTTYYRPLEAS